jgi:drug/metabolite transporter (DMT)-like permease
MYYIFLALLSAALFGAATPLNKALLSSLNALQLAGLLYLGASLGVSYFSFGKRIRGQPWQMNGRNLFRLSGAVLFGGILAPVFLLLGLKLASAASVSLWLPLELVATAVLGRMIFRDYLGRWGWVGMVGVLVASILLSFGEGTSGIRSGLLILLACLCWGFDNNVTSLIDGITPAQITFWKGLIAGVVNLSIGLLTKHGHVPVSALVGALGVGALSYGVSIVLYITAAQNIGAIRGQMFFASSPFFGAGLSYLFLGETVTSIQVAAMIILMGSLILVFRDRHEHVHIHGEMEHEHDHRHDDEHHQHEHPPGKTTGRHIHRHKHEPVVHSHPHWPDLHHRHDH